MCDLTHSSTRRLISSCCAIVRLFRHTRKPARLAARTRTHPSTYYLSSMCNSLMTAQCIDKILATVLLARAQIRSLTRTDFGLQSTSRLHAQVGDTTVVGRGYLKPMSSAGNWVLTFPSGQFFPNPLLCRTDNASKLSKIMRFSPAISYCIIKQDISQKRETR